MAASAHRLAADPILLSRLVAKRPEWTVEAIENTALEGDLGYEADCRFNEFGGPATLFGYSHGIKARWKDKRGERVIRWICGSAAGQCWRQSLLRRDHKKIFFGEGETNALGLLSLGLEDCGESLIVGLAGANILPYPEPFADKDVIIIPDPDAPGQSAAQKLTTLLKAVAKSVVTIQFGELGDG